MFSDSSSVVTTGPPTLVVVVISSDEDPTSEGPAAATDLGRSKEGSSEDSLSFLYLRFRVRVYDLPSDHFRRRRRRRRHRRRFLHRRRRVHRQRGAAPVSSP